MFRDAYFCALLVTCALLVLSAQRVEAQNATGSLPKKLTLAEAENLLIQRNLTVLAAKYQIEAGRANKLIAGYKPNPVLTIGAEQLTLAHPFRNDVNESAQRTLTLRIDKIIERGGKRELRTEQADEQLKANEAMMVDAIRTQLYQLHQAFTTATLARENLLLAETTQEQYERTLKLTEAKVENGDLPGVEVYRARAGLLTYQQTVLQARTAYEQATRDVLNLLGARPEDIESGAQTAQSNQLGQSNFSANLPDGARIIPASNDIEPGREQQISLALRNAPLEIAATLDDRPIIQTPSELRQIALAERPDVAAARHTFEAANRNLALAQSQRVRDIAVGAEYQRVGVDNSVGAVLSVPLFIYNNQRAGISQAEAQRKASEALLRQAELQAATDVEKAYQSYLSARRTLDLYGSQNLSQIEKLRNIATLSYKEGASSLFELLDAQRTYNTALTAYNQARADYQLALWQLEHAIGKPLR